MRFRNEINATNLQPQASNRLKRQSGKNYLLQKINTLRTTTKKSKTKPKPHTTAPGGGGGVGMRVVVVAIVVAAVVAAPLVVCRFDTKPRS